MFINRKKFKNSFKKIKVCGIVLIFFSIFATLPVLAVNNFEQKCTYDPNAVVLSIPVPGMPLYYNQACNVYEFKGDGGSLMADYVKYLYKFLVGIAGILTVFMIMFGGVQWIFSGGSTTKISAAKETILGATIGLFLAIGSYTLLKTINPSLVNLSLNVGTIKVGDSILYNEDGSCKSSEDIPCGYLCEPSIAGGELVMGKCEWANTANVNDCGKVLDGFDITMPSSEGNRWYAKCGGSKACTYAEQPTSGVTVYTPECKSKMVLKYDNKTHTYNFDNGGWGNRDKCGEIITVTQTSGGNYAYAESFISDRRIGSWCDNDEACIIDISEGYNIISDPEATHLGKFKIGSFSNYKCIK